MSRREQDARTNCPQKTGAKRLEWRFGDIPQSIARYRQCRWFCRHIAMNGFPDFCRELPGLMYLVTIAKHKTNFLITFELT